MTRLVDAHWGTAETPLPDWRKVLADDDEPDDDEELKETPADVIAMLGFDPLHPDDDSADDEALEDLALDGQFNESDHPRANNGEFGSGGGSGGVQVYQGGSYKATEREKEGFARGPGVKITAIVDPPKTPAKSSAPAKTAAQADPDNRTKVSVEELRKKLAGMTTEKLKAAHTNPAIDPKIKAHIGRELTSRLLSGGDQFAEDWLAPGESSRKYDDFGRLHVGSAHISKAAVNEYFGREIPNWQTLGLQGDRRYKLLRDPDELALAAPTFNNIPVMSRHVAHSARDHKPDVVIGATGSDAKFEFPYLDNSLVVWAGPEIEKIEEGLKEQLSCSYGYVPDMTPGAFQGESYDGRMTKIVGNHVAVVVAGRAGPDVLIGDSKPEDHQPTEDQPIMANVSRKALAVQFASVGYLAGKLAADAKPDLTPIFAGVTFDNYKASKPTIVAAITAATRGKLAANANLDGLPAFLGAFDEVDPDDKEKPKAEDEETDEEKEAREKKEAADKKAKDAKIAKDKKAKDEEAETDEEKAARLKKEAATASDEEKDKADKTAMDAAIASATEATEKRIVARMKAAREAEAFVRPWVGNMAIAYDSAEEIERAAAVYLKIPKAKEVHASALRTLIEMMPKAGERPANPARQLAADSRSEDAAAGFASRYPNAAKVRVL